MQMVKSMKVNSSKTKPLVWVSTSVKKEKFMKVTSLIINHMEKENRSCLMVPSILVISTTVEKKVMESIFGLINHIIKENGKITYLKAMENTNGKMVANTLGSGKIIR